jgi:hypothetical protein
MDKLINKENFLPKLVDLSKFNIPIPKTHLSKTHLPIKKWNLNKILLLGFLIFTIFFLYNCKYGIFKNKDYISPVAYS